MKATSEVGIQSLDGQTVVHTIMSSSVAGFIVINSLDTVEPAPFKDLLHPYL